jgi:hypothetical protein
VYKRTFERGDGYQISHHDTSSFRDHVIDWYKDLARSIDYLETRPDIGIHKIAYEGVSWGSEMGAVFPALEDRSGSWC